MKISDAFIYKKGGLMVWKEYINET